MRRVKTFRSCLVPVLLLIGAPVEATEVVVTPDQVQGMEIRVETVKIAETEPVALLPGTVIPALSAEVAATAPFAGTVTRVLVLPGQPVKKGDPLISVSSRELLDAESAHRQAQAEVQVADAIARRKRSLVKQKFQSPVVAEEAEAQVAKLQAVVDQYRKTLGIGGIQIGTSGEYTVTAPADGKIVETKVSPGDRVEAMAPVLSIDANDELWVKVQIPANLVARLKLGDRIKVVDGPEGRIISIGGSLDHMTRSAEMLALLDPGSDLLPGQMVAVTILRRAETGGLSVPANAVAWIDQKPNVFVRSDQGFRLVAVTVRGKSTEQATVSGALSAGQEVASTGLPQLEQMLSGD